MNKILSDDTENIIDCLCGLCPHASTEKHCPYNKIIDSDEPELALKAEFIKVIRIDRKERIDKANKK